MMRSTGVPARRRRGAGVDLGLGVAVVAALLALDGGGGAASAPSSVTPSPMLLGSTVVSHSTTSISGSFTVWLAGAAQASRSLPVRITGSVSRAAGTVRSTARVGGGRDEQQGGEGGEGDPSHDVRNVNVPRFLAPKYLAARAAAGRRAHPDPRSRARRRCCRSAAFDAPFGRADWVIDARPVRGARRGRGARAVLSAGRGSCATRARASRGRSRTTASRSRSARRSPALRDPVGVCFELSRVARAGYVEVPTIEAELAGGEARWLCDVVDAELVFVHKSVAVAADARVKVPPRWHARLTASERVHGLFWEDRLPARERIVEREELVDELAERLRRRFEPSAAEVAVAEARVGSGRWPARPRRAASTH